MISKTGLQWVLGFSVVFLGACSPKFYLVDRQTVLEEEASGEWPDFEEDLFNHTKKSGVTEFPKTADNNRKARLFQTLNGEWTGISK